MFHRKTNVFAIIEISGVISASAPKSALSSSGFHLMKLLSFLSDLEDEDERLDGILLRLNTPGGTAGASEELARAIDRVKQARRVPVVASIADICCSGGYMVAVVADKIFANRQSLTGSIGTILQIPNYQELAEKIGIKTLTFKSGKMKDIGNPMRDMTDDERAFLDDIAHKGHELFMSFVKEHRPDIQNETEMMDGRPVDALLAKENHLIDAFGTYLDAYDALRELAHIKKGVPIKELRVKEEKGILKRLVGTLATPNLSGLAEDFMMQSHARKF